MPDHPLRREGLLVQVCVRMNGAAGRPFIHDPLDSVSAAAALGAASEAGIDLAHAVNWSRLSEHKFRVDKWNVYRG